MAKTEKANDLANNSEKLKALKLTIDKIEKDFGKGSVMMMNERADTTGRSYLYRFYWSWMSPLASGVFQKEGLLKYMVPSHRVKQLLQFM